jgi:hypothetical protein
MKKGKREKNALVGLWKVFSSSQQPITAERKSFT